MNAYDFLKKAYGSSTHLTPLNLYIELPYGREQFQVTKVGVSKVDLIDDIGEYRNLSKTASYKVDRVSLTSKLTKPKVVLHLAREL